MKLIRKNSRFAIFYYHRYQFHPLAQLCKEKGYTQSELAEKIGVSNKSVSRWEIGISKS